MARVAATGPLKSTAARQMRRTAQQLDADHPETVAGDHVRDAARVLERGSAEGAQRHLDAAMELLTPRNLMRHGILDDEGHATAKHHMHQVHRHLLNVQDIADVTARNEQLRETVRARREEQASGRLQQAAQRRPGAGPEAPDAATRLSVELASAWQRELRNNRGEWSRGFGAMFEGQGARGHGGSVKAQKRSSITGPSRSYQTVGPFGKKISKGEATAFTGMIRKSAGKPVNEKAERHSLRKSQRVIYDKLRRRNRGHAQAMYMASRFSPQMLAAALSGGQPGIDLARFGGPALHRRDLGEPRDWHGRWSLVAGGTHYEGPPGGIGHAQAMEAAATQVRKVSDTAANAVRNATRLMMSRRLGHARRHMDLAIAATKGTGSQKIMKSIRSSLDDVPAYSQPMPGPAMAPVSVAVQNLMRQSGFRRLHNPAGQYVGDAAAIELAGKVYRYRHGWIRIAAAQRATALALVRQRRKKLQLDQFGNPRTRGAKAEIGILDVLTTPAKIVEKTLPKAHRQRKNAAPAMTFSARTASLERTPAPYGKPGGPGLYGVKGLKHSNYFEQVVQALMTKRGMDKGRASKIAWGALRKWRRGGGHVHPEVVAAANRALAKEDVARAAAHSHSITGLDVADALIELAATPPEVIDLFNPYHAPTGKFTTASGAGKGQPKGHGGRAHKAALRVKIRALRSQIAALRAQLPKTGKGSHKAAKVGKAKSAAALKAAAARKAKAGSTPRKKGAVAHHRMSTATIHAKIAALEATLRADITELRAL